MFTDFIDGDSKRDYIDLTIIVFFCSISLLLLGVELYVEN